MQHPYNYINPTIIEERKLNIAQMDVFSRLMVNRIIFLGEPINDEVANIIIGQLLYLDSVNHDPIQLYLNTPGGGIYSGLAIFDTIKGLTSEVSTVCIGLAASMGSILLLAGKERAILKHSRVMMHQPSAGIRGTAREIEITHEEVQKLKKELYNIIETESNVTNAEEFCRDDKWLTAQEAFDLGIVNKLL